MHIEILATESLGVRGLCCLVKAAGRTIVIDPGAALGYRREGLLPHPAQVAVGEQIRENIVSALRYATDVVISHFHGDHMPLPDANPYQLDVSRVVDYLRRTRLWTKDWDQESEPIRRRVERFQDILEAPLEHIGGQAEGPFRFSEPVPHGERDSGLGTVMMTRLENEGEVFVHASDIQLLAPEPVEQILRWEPTVVLVSGPPLYLDLSSGQEETAWSSALRLARHVDTCIIDHHLLRCEEGIAWLERLGSETSNRVCPWKTPSTRCPLWRGIIHKRPRNFKHSNKEGGGGSRRKCKQCKTGLGRNRRLATTS